MAQPTRLQARLKVEAALESLEQALAITTTWMKNEASERVNKQVNDAHNLLQQTYWSLGDDV